MATMNHKDFTWHNLISPKLNDLKSLQEKYEFHELDIEDCLSEHERPKIDEYEHYLFFVLHIPYSDPHTKRVMKEEVDIFLGRDFIVTIHDGNVQLIEKLWELLEKNEAKREMLLGQGSGFFLYKLVSDLFDHGFPEVDNIYKDLRRIERELFEWEDEVDLLRDILRLSRNIITMRSIILPQRAVIAALEHKNKKFTSEGMDVYYDDILDAIERQWSLLETAKEFSRTLQTTHESWVVHKTNFIVRVLTIFSVVVLPLLVIPGIYGMNVQLPYADSPNMFWALLVVMIGLTFSGIGYLAWKKWL